MQSDAIVRAIFTPVAVLYTLTVVTGENGTVIIDPDMTVFTPGDSVLLTARPNAGFYFGGWEGDTIGLESSIMVKMTKNISVSAIFTEEGKVSLTVSAQNGRIDRSPDHQSYSKGDTVTLTATPDAGYRFVSWSGTLGNTNPLNLILNESMQVTATFARLKYRLTLNSDTGGTITAPSLPDSVEHGVATTITATAAAGYTFAGWRVTSGSATIGDSTKATTTVTLTSGNATVRAIFTQSAFTLTIPQPTNGTVARVPANKTTFTHGETVTLTAQPATGYFFGGWGEDTSGTATSITVTMTRDRTISATFAIVGSLTLTTTAANGTVTRSPVKTSYQYGDQVTLTATPNTGYTFSSWSGGASGSSNPVTITMDDHKAVTANFTIISHTVQFNSQGGSAVGSQTVSHGGKITAPSAEPTQSGYRFLGWYKEAGGINAWNFNQDVVTGPVTLFAKWIRRFTLTVSSSNAATTPVSGAHTVDSGHTTTLQINGVDPGYCFGQWTLSPTSAGTLTNATSQTAATVRLTAGNATVTATVVFQSTAPDGITGTTTIQSGTRTTLTASGGTHGSGASYQWGKESCGSNIIQGATNQSYQTDPLTGNTTYWVRRTGGCGGTTNCATATVTVHFIQINTPPANRKAVDGENVSFSVAATGNPAPSYQWERQTGDGAFSVIEGATSATYSFAATLNTHLNTKYRCVVTNAAGSVTSSVARLDMVLRDADNNEYNIVKIGNQYWTVENLRATKYMDGTDIQHVSLASTWAILNTNETPAYCFYNNTTDPNAQRKWGALYNWYVVAPYNPRKISPSGWRAPSRQDWNNLRTHIGGAGFGGLLKETGTKEAGTGSWSAPNADATNETHFTALPSGQRSSDGSYSLMDTYTAFWSTDDDDERKGIGFSLRTIDGAFSMNTPDKRIGNPIRLAKDVN